MNIFDGLRILFRRTKILINPETSDLKEMVTLSGEATPPFYMFAFPLNRGQFLKERICSHWSKFFPLRVDDRISEGFRSPGKQTRDQTIIPLRINGGKKYEKKIPKYTHTPSPLIF